MKNKKAITFVELIVSITISIIIMTSIWVFINSWLRNIFIQEKNISSSLSINNFFYELKNTLDKFEKKYKISANNIIFKRETEYNNWGFSFIWTTQKTDFCENWVQTNHIFIKNFIPTWSDNFEIVSWNFKSNQKENKIFDLAWNTIIWKDIFWNEEIENWKNFYLNWPTWLAQIWDKLYISDSLNNRILEYDIQKKFISVLFWKESWINLPIKLLANWKKLFIENAWNSEVLAYSLEAKKVNPEFIFEKKFFNFNKITLTFSKTNADNKNFDLTEKDQLNINWKIYQKEKSETRIIFKITEKDEEFTKLWILENWKVKYEHYVKVRWKPQKTNFEKNFDEIKDTITKIEKTITYNQVEEDLENLYEIKVTTTEGNNSLYYKPIPSMKSIFLANWKFYKKVENQIKSLDENWDEIITTEEKFFEVEEIWLKKINFHISDFFQNEHLLWEWSFYLRLTLKQNEKNIFSSNEILVYKTNVLKLEKDNSWILNVFDVNNTWTINYDKNYDTILDIPIKNLEISQDWDFINLILKYYRSFDCYDPDLNEKKINTLILKKKI